MRLLVIKVHHLNNSRAQRVLWLLEELELPYELVKYERDPKTMLAPKSLQDIHPLGKSPVITDGAETLAESGAILEYLVETYGKGKLAPAPGTPGYRHYKYFLHYSEGSLMPYLLMNLVFHKVKTAKLPFFVKPIAKKIAEKVGADFIEPNLTRHFEFLDQHLAKHAWFAGDELSAADIQMSYPLEAAAERGNEHTTQRMRDWLAKIQARPAYKRALERGK